MGSEVTCLERSCTLLILSCENIKRFFYSLLEDMSKQLPAVQRQSIQEATAEAEARPLEYNPTERAQYIRRMLHDIPLWQSQGDSEDVIKQRVPTFVEQYPELFKKMMKKQDLGPIQKMLPLLDRMGQGNISQHQASVLVGKQLVDQYVTPQLNGSAARTSGL